MQFTISASGKPAAVKVAVQQQIVAVRKDNPESAGVGGALLDAFARHVATAGVDDIVSVSGSVSLMVKVTPAATPETESEGA